MRLLLNLKNTFYFTAGMFMLAGCYTDPYVNDIATKRPELADMVGTYKFESQTIREFGSWPKKETDTWAITLRSNGTFKAINLPNLLKPADSAEPDNISATGKWRIDSVEVNEHYEQPYYGIVLTGISENYKEFKLLGNKPPYKLMIMNDDPSLGRVIIFSK